MRRETPQERAARERAETSEQAAAAREDALWTELERRAQEARRLSRPLPHFCSV